jgi:phosphatidyl-myo-inositol dimannoside synthase
MARLLVVTDHRFYRRDRRIVDAYCFDRAFFADYQAIFSEVVVAARVRRDEPPETARPADGDGVRFVELPDHRWVRWILSTWFHMPGLKEAIGSADAVCLRIPSGSSRVALRYAVRFRKPLMFELIGDPKESLRNLGVLARLFARLNARLVRRITHAAVVGSYVSNSHLQRLYPAGTTTVVDSISSIRLLESELRPPKTYPTDMSGLRLVHVGSMVPVKDHETLLRGLALAVVPGLQLRLSLVGDGPMRPGLEKLVRELGLLEAVTFHGHIADRAGLKAILRASDLFVMPSISEGMPRAMIEAMAEGLPAIGSATGGITELLMDDQLFAVGDSAGLASRLVQVANSERLSELAIRSAAMAQRFVASALSERRRRLLTLLKTASERIP